MTKKIDIKDLKSGPMMREELTPFMEKWARNIYQSLGSDLIGTYEYFEAGFCRDHNPLKELFVWNMIASSLEAWEYDHPLCNREEIFGQLLAFTLGAEVENSLTPITISELKDLMERVKSTISKRIKEK